jgi:hypothetical protein
MVAFTARHNLLRRQARAHYQSIFLLLISSAATLACYIACGPGLGLFFGGLFVATLLIPAAALARTKLVHALDSVAAIILGIAGVWIVAVVRTEDTTIQWFLVVITLAAYGLALGGLARAIHRFYVPDVFAAAVVVILGIAWMCWPVWLAPHLSKSTSDRTINLMVSLHPPLVINGVLLGEPPWTERTIAYQLTNLNQDIPMQLPTSALLGTVINLILGAGFFAISQIPRKTRK